MICFQANGKIVQLSATLLACDSVEIDNSTVLRDAGDLIMDVSGINFEDLSLLKIATALKKIWCPEEADNSCEVNYMYYFVNVCC